MIDCPKCGHQNTNTSKFCSVCGQPLEPISSIAAEQVPPANLSNDELQAHLITAATTTPSGVVEQPATPATDATQPLVAPVEEGSFAALPGGTKVGDYQIVDREGEQAGGYVYRATVNNICQQCQTRTDEPEARFCEQCGAELVPHDVLLYERDPNSDSPPTGPWRLLDLPDDPSRALLPAATTFEWANRRYLVAEAIVPGFISLAERLASKGDGPQQPVGLEPVDALPLALQLARLLDFLHRNGSALGDLSLAQLLLGKNHVLRLRDAAHLRELSEPSRKADLDQLAQTLEELTRTPRQTVKLDPAAAERPPEPTLERVISQGRTGALSDAAAWVAALETIARSQQAIQPLQTNVGTTTNVGMVRELNEDSCLVQELRLGVNNQLVNAGVYVVADGMGGHESGEVASRIAINAVQQSAAARLSTLASDAPAGVSDAVLQEIVVAAGQSANKEVYAESQRRHNDMGTTLTFAVVVGDRCVIGNVGDSRTYLLRKGQLQRITKDHSLVMRLVEVGQITEDEIYTHPHRNAILRSLGDKPEVEVDTFPVRLQSGDALLLCSDGLWEMVHNPRLQEVITQAAEPQVLVDQLIDEANQNGGEDNITGVLVRFSSTGKH